MDNAGGSVNTVSLLETLIGDACVFDPGLYDESYILYKDMVKLMYFT